MVTGNLEQRGMDKVLSYGRFERMVNLSALSLNVAASD